MILLENTFTKLFGRAPHLRDRWIARLARGSWWITLIVSLIYSLIFIGSVVVLVGYLRYAVANLLLTSGAMAYLYAAALIINLLIFVVSIILLVSAVPKLKKLMRRGWVLIYVFMLLQLVGQVILPFVFAIIFALIDGRGGATNIESSDYIDLTVQLGIFIVTLYFIFQTKEAFTSPTTVERE